MNILAIESSCDETGCAVVNDGTVILSNTVASSVELHQKYGGIYPEIAARRQSEVIIPVIDETLKKWGEKKDKIDSIAVTLGPGLIGSLLVGVEAAKTLAYVLNKPIIPVNHVTAHLYSNWIDGKNPSFPAIALIVSGGHTQLLLMNSHSDIILLGETIDDAAGEALDKSARLIGLPYPGGPHIEKESRDGDSKAFQFPLGMIHSGDYNFSFSGLKTAVLRETKKLKTISVKSKKDIAASVQEAVVSILVTKTIKAVIQYKPKSLLIAGGVAANSRLRNKFDEEIRNFNLEFFAPKLSLCSDNAAFIGSYAFFHNKPVNLFTLSAQANLDFSY